MVLQHAERPNEAAGLRCAHVARGAILLLPYDGLLRGRQKHSSTVR